MTRHAWATQAQTLSGFTCKIAYSLIRSFYVLFLTSYIRAPPARHASDITMLRDSSFTRTDAALRQILQRTFATNELYTFDELVSDISDCIDIPFDFLMFIQERSWFNSSGPLLKFTYLSFEYKSGTARRFEDRQSLESRENELKDQGYETATSDLCSLLYQYGCDDDVTRVVNLLMRIVVAFYLNCGYHDHFRNAVASRFVREFFKSRPSSDVPPLLAFIEQRIGLRVTLWQPCDEMYFTGDKAIPANKLLRPFSGTSSIPLELFEDETFARDLRTSVLRMNQTSGVSALSRQQYVIKTFSVGHVTQANSALWSSYKVRQNAVAVFQSPNATDRLSLDAAFHAGKVIETFLEACDALNVTNVLVNADNRCLNREARLAAAPLDLSAQIYDAFADTLAPTVDDVARITDASAIIIWLHDPFSDVLHARLVRSYDDSLSNLSHCPPLAASGYSEHLVQKCFSDGRHDSLHHPEWISTELFINQANKTPGDRRNVREEQLTADRERRAHLANSGGTSQCSCITFPIQRGGILVGVLEVVSTRVGQLTFDFMLLERFAYVCGDTLRRLELANDRAWLARMSFVYACRHRIEELLRDVETKAGEVGRELAEMFRGDQMPAEGDLSSTSPKADHRGVSRLRKALRGECLPDAVDRWLANVERVLTEIGASPVVYDCIAEITDTLLANRTHSPFSLDAFHVMVSMRDPQRFSEIIVLYDPSEIWVDEDRMLRIGVSPIRSSSSLTFHYGLFLLSAQVRMLGGCVQSKCEYNAIGCGKFGVAFRIPARIPEDGHNEAQCAIDR